MPRPHYPVSAGALAHRRYSVGANVDALNECPGCQAKNAEINRLGQELAKVQRDAAFPRGAGISAGSGMMWAALGICGVAIVFALAAILRHG